jgi:hypothetical protein
MSFSEAPTQLPLSSQTWPGLTGDQLTQRGESMTMCGVFSGRSVLRNVVCQTRIPALEPWPESAVECPRAHLEQQVCATRGPLHLLTLAKRLLITAFTRGFGQA